MPDPKSSYAISKLAGEYHCKVFQELCGLKTVFLRYFNIVGPRQNQSSEYSGVASRFISALAKGEQPVIFGDGQQTRDFVHVIDAVRANILVAAQAVASSRSSVGGVLA